jgi:hypothetical protein
MPELDDIAINDGAKPLTYVANDWFYMKTGANQECNDAKNYADCKKNESAVNVLRDTTNHLGTWTTQYNDAKMLFNRELLFTVNLIAGLVMICYYIYVNQSSFPSPMAALKGMGEVGNKMGALVKSAPALPK